MKSLHSIIYSRNWKIVFFLHKYNFGWYEKITETQYETKTFLVLFGEVIKGQTPIGSSKSIFLKEISPWIDSQRGDKQFRSSSDEGGVGYGLIGREFESFGPSELSGIVGKIPKTKSSFFQILVHCEGLCGLRGLFCGQERRTTHPYLLYNVFQKCYWWFDPRCEQITRQFLWTRPLIYCRQFEHGTNKIIIGRHHQKIANQCNPTGLTPPPPPLCIFRSLRRGGSNHGFGPHVSWRGGGGGGVKIFAPAAG